MFERVGIEQKIREKMKDDEELEMLLGEIPHEVSLNRNYSQRNGNLLSRHGYGSFVNHTLNGMMYGKYDDDPSSYAKYTCTSPGSGFSLQSNDSSSSLLSGGYSFCDNGSPTPPPLVELKSQMPCLRSHQPDGPWLDLRVLNPPIVKMDNEDIINELNLSRNFGRLCLRDYQDNPSADLNGVGLCDQFSCGTNRIHLEKFGDSVNYTRDFSDYGGPESSVPRSPMWFEGKMSPLSTGLGCENRLYPFMEPHYPRSRADDLFSHINGISSLSSYHHQGTKEQASTYYQRRIPQSNFVSSTTQSPVADSFVYYQQNGMNEEQGLNFLSMPSATHPWPHLGVGNILHSHPQLHNGWTRGPLNAGIPQRTDEAYSAEESFIIQAEGVNYVTKKGSGRPRGHYCMGSLNGIGVVKPQGKMSELDGYPYFGGIHKNGQNEEQYCSSILPPKCNSLEEARGCINLIAKEQDGCRFLQKMFKTPQDVQIILNEIIDHVFELSMNPFGNYLMQKLLEVCNEEQRVQILIMITEVPGQLIRISLNSHGTRVVQKLIETLKTRQQISLAISALKPGFLTLIKDLNGNHVIQRCLKCLSNEDNKFLFVAAAKHCVEIATHQHGCCVLQRCITLSTGEYRDNLVTEISANGLQLAQDAFGFKSRSYRNESEKRVSALTDFIMGQLVLFVSICYAPQDLAQLAVYKNFVVQLILDLKIRSATSNLISLFNGNYVHLSTQKFSSHVVEKCLVVFDDKMRSKIIHELLSASHFVQLLQDPHANYVLQTALRVSQGPLRDWLVDAIESCKAISRNSPYSKRIFSQNLLKK